MARRCESMELLCEMLAGHVKRQRTELAETRAASAKQEALAALSGKPSAITASMLGAVR